MSALHMSVNPMFHAQSMHIELDYHFVSEKDDMGTLVTRFISPVSQPSDIFMKPLSNDVFLLFHSKLGVNSNYHANLRRHIKEKKDTGTFVDINSHNTKSMSDRGINHYNLGISSQ
ncbi:hypothetical protein EZV62_022275 [Acer yangbiense]|uniref:Uncharacterized protein n=1 Tax=Acer yangbiense TaxID=1000413 RepID=A0A5C7HA74_9ROSI|nr:hypothetical protein EZV62_022275 [Acer yangbiense]